MIENSNGHRGEIERGSAVTQGILIELESEERDSRSQIEVWNSADPICLKILFLRIKRRPFSHSMNEFYEIERSTAGDS